MNVGQIFIVNAIRYFLLSYVFSTYRPKTWKMDPSYPLLEAFSQGQQARDMRLYDEAWQHFTNALEFSRVANYHDPSLSCQILLERAGVSMTMQRFTEAKRDIDHALTVCPQQVHKPVSINYSPCCVYTSKGY